MTAGKDMTLELRHRLLDWFDRERRPMPWRDSPSPYRIWISEIMLQQTQVATVTPYFERFVARFPDVASLAAAEEEEVLALWSGLGYYRRARNLRHAARQLMAESGGRLPTTREELARLPGVGPYTAGAIASIAFDRAEAALDGNGIRVLTRLHALAGDPARQPLKGELWTRLGGLVDGGRPGDLNQAVMEFGARVCTPRNPRCESCCLGEFCAAAAEGRPSAYPQLERDRGSQDILVEVGLFRRANSILFSRGRRPFLGALWNLPYRVLDGGEAFERERWSSLGLKLGAVRRLGHGDHRITRYRVRQKVIGGDAETVLREAIPEYRWADVDQRARFGLSAFSAKLLSAFSGEDERRS